VFQITRGKEIEATNGLLHRQHPGIPSVDKIQATNRWERTKVKQEQESSGINKREVKSKF
jgi:hypothetical protein